MLRPVLLVGDVNPYSPNPDHALLPWPNNSAGDRLRRLLNMTDRAYLRVFERMNLRQPGEGWQHHAVLRRVEILRRRTAPMVLLGRSVQRALGYRLSGQDVRQVGHVLLVPHPSGRCRVWNDPKSVAFFRMAVGALIGLNLTGAVVVSLDEELLG